MHINHRDIGAGEKLLGEGAYIKYVMKSNGCDKQLIQSITIISYKLNENNVFFTISHDNKNFTFTIKSPTFNEIKSPITL